MNIINAKQLWIDKFLLQPLPKKKGHKKVWVSKSNP